MFYVAWQGESQAEGRAAALKSLGFCIPTLLVITLILMKSSLLRLPSAEKAM